MVSKVAMIRNFLVAFIFLYLIAGRAIAVPAIVDRVLDGDTFAARVKLEDETNITVRVRLLDVDTPEIDGACQKEIDMARKAQNRTTQLLPVGSVVDLYDIKDDKYLGRIDAKVIMPDGRDLSNVLIKENLGRPYDGGKRQSWCK